MIKTKSFLGTTLLGGLAAILPLALLIILVRWIIRLIEKYLEPLVNLVKPDNEIGTIITYVIITAIILACFFFIGLFIKTRVGNMIRNHLEHKYLMKIPGYRTTKEVVMQFFGSKNSFFSEVVLVEPFGNGILMTGFITDDRGDYISVFVPTGPNPTSGNIFHVQRDKVRRSSIPVDVAVKSIISCGAGSSDVINAAIPETEKKETKVSQ
jgi:uncharacterized membrane protein